MFQAFEQHLAIKDPSQLYLKYRQMRIRPLKDRLKNFSRKTAFSPFQKSLSPLTKTRSARQRFSHYTNNDTFRNQRVSPKPLNQYYINDLQFPHQHQHQLKLNLKNPSDLASHQLKSGPSDLSTDNSWNSRRKQCKPQLQKFANILKRKEVEQQPQNLILLKKADTDDCIYQRKCCFEEDSYRFLLQFKKSQGYQQRHPKYNKGYLRQTEVYRQNPQNPQNPVTINLDEKNQKYEKIADKNRKINEQEQNAKETEYGDIGFLEQDLKRAYNKFERGRNTILKSIEIENTPNKMNDLTMGATF